MQGFPWYSGCGHAGVVSRHQWNGEFLLYQSTQTPLSMRRNNIVLMISNNKCTLPSKDSLSK
eukprot:scaffold35581_cov522-Skeletonema_dohrnii-CCMP3373.AAC.1